MISKNSAKFLWIVQLLVGLAHLHSNLNSTEGDQCFATNGNKSINGTCTYEDDCEAPCTGNLTYCDKTIVCCPLPLTGQRISAQKCAEYKENACEVTYASNMMNSIPVGRKHPKCPFEVVELIANGTVARQGEFPHMALIGYTVNNETRWDCGGTLISERFVLTAAHCVETRNGNATYVQLGGLSLNGNDGINFTVTDWIRHPYYNKTKRFNDIGLLKLDRNVEFTLYIRPACLPEYSNHANRAMATGWGEILRMRDRSKDLLKVTLDIFPSERCDEAYAGTMEGELDENQLCAGSNVFSNNICSGDSGTEKETIRFTCYLVGGPLQIYHDQEYCSYIVIGVTAFGDQCPGGKGSSSVFTRVFPFLKWIEDVVWLNEL